MTATYYPWLKLQKDTYGDQAIARLTLAQQAVFYNLLQFAGKQPTEGSFDAADREALALEVAQEEIDTLNATLERLLKYKVLRRDAGDVLTFTKWEKHQATKKDKNAARQRQFYGSHHNEGERQPQPEESTNLTEPNASVRQRQAALEGVSPSISASLSPSISSLQALRRDAREPDEEIRAPEPEVMEVFEELGLRVTKRRHSLLKRIRTKHGRVDFVLAALDAERYVRETGGDAASEDDVIDAICSAVARYDDPAWSRYWRNAGHDVDPEVAAHAWDTPDTEQFAPCNTEAWRTIRPALADRLRGNYAPRFGNAADHMRDGRLVLTFLDEYDRDMAEQRYGDIVREVVAQTGSPDLAVEYAVLGQDVRAAG